jgi:hypothetical protein
MKYIIGFGQFWYDFIVGDSIFLAIGGVLMLILGYALVQADASGVAEVLLPVTVAATLVASLPLLRR